MKRKLFAVMTAVLLSIAAFAQDVITLTDGKTVNAKVTEITETSVKYKRADNPSGPIYTIALDKVNKITYENGTVDEYNVTQTTPPEQQTASSASTASKTLATIHNQNDANDTQLLNLYNRYHDGREDPWILRDTARKYKKIAWIGGIPLAVVGTGLAFLLGKDQYGSINPNDDLFIAPLCVGVGGGIIWWGAWTIAANKKMNLARMADSYSEALFESEILNLGGNKSLTGSVNMMGNYLTRLPSLGVGLSYNF